MIPALESLITFLSAAAFAIGAAGRSWYRRVRSGRTNGGKPGAEHTVAEDEEEIVLGTVLPWTVDPPQPAPDGIEEERDEGGVAPSAPAAAMGRRPRAPGTLVSIAVPILFRHIIAFGATGSGKSTILWLLFSFLWRWIISQKRGAIFVLDPFGDFVSRVLSFLSRVDPEVLGSVRVVLLDLADSGSAATWNPLAGPGDAFRRAIGVLEVIRQWHPDGIGVTVEELLRNTLIAFAEAGENLAAIEPFLMDPAFRRAVLSRVRDEFVLRYFERFEEDERQATTIAATWNKVSGLLAGGRLRRLFSNPGEQAPEAINLEQGLNSPRPTLVLVSLATHAFPGRTGFLIGSLFLTAIERIVLSRVDVLEEKRVPLFVIVDEFGALAALGASVEQLTVQARRLKCALILATQNISLIPATSRPTLRNNVGTKLMFATGAVDAGELVSEVVADVPREVIRQTIIRQPVGAAIACLRGEEGVRIQVPFRPEPEADPAAVAALRERLRGVPASTSFHVPTDTAASLPEGAARPADALTEAAGDTSAAPADGPDHTPDATGERFEIREVNTHGTTRKTRKRRPPAP